MVGTLGKEIFSRAHTTVPLINFKCVTSIVGIIEFKVMKKTSKALLTKLKPDLIGQDKIPHF
jgi:hypothetical protein